MNRFPTQRRRFRFGDWPIRYKVLGGVFAAALLPILVAVSFVAVRYAETLNTARAALTAEVQDGVIRLRDTLSNMLEAVGEETAPDERLMTHVNAQLTAIREEADPETLEAFASETTSAMNAVLNNNYNYTAMRLLNMNGSRVANAGNVATTPSVRSDIQTDHPTYLQTVETLQGRPVIDTPILIGPYADPQNQHILMEVVLPVIQENAAAGYLIFTLDTAVVLEQPLGLVFSRNPMPIQTPRNIYLIDRQGNLLTGIYGQNAMSRQVHIPITGQGTGTQQGTAQYEIAWDAGPEIRIGSFELVPTYNWFVIAELPLGPTIRPVIDLAVSTILPLVITIGLVAFGALYIVDRQVIAPLLTLTRTVQQITQGGNYAIHIPTRMQNDELGVLNTAFSTMTENVRSSIELLEQRVRERTRDIEITTQIGREASALHDVNELLTDAVNLIVNNFKAIYHAQVFLVDEESEDAVLVASTGEPGRQLLARGHRLAVGSLSVIGRVTETGQTVIARDTSTSPVHKKNEFLPDTRAEMAIPLMRGGQILGALDVQSTEPDAFTADDQRTFETLAAQLSVAIDNARLFTEARRRTTEVEELNRLMMRTAWRVSLAAGRRRGDLTANAGAPAPGYEAGEMPWRQEAMEQGEMIVSPPQADKTVIMAAPIIVRGEPLGVVEWTLPAENDTEYTRQMARELVARLSVTLENVRLLEHSERLAERERLVNQIGNRLTVQPNVGHILETAVRELSQVLGTSQVGIQLKRPNGAPERGSTESA